MPAPRFPPREAIPRIQKAELTRSGAYQLRIIRACAGYIGVLKNSMQKAQQATEVEKTWGEADFKFAEDDKMVAFVADQNANLGIAPSTEPLCRTNSPQQPPETFKVHK